MEAKMKIFKMGKKKKQLDDLNRRMDTGGKKGQ